MPTPVNQSIYQSDQVESTFTKMCATVGSLIIALLTLLQVKYENKDVSPFETHGVVMILFIVTMLINTLVAAAAITVQIWFTNHSLVPVLNQIFLVFGVLACGLLALILVPPLGYFLLAIWALLLLPLLLYYVFTLVLRQLLRNCSAYNTVQNFFHECMVRYPLLHAAPQASAASPMARANMARAEVGPQDGFSQISNEMNAAPQASTASPMARANMARAEVGPQDGFSQISNEMNAAGQLDEFIIHLEV